MQSFTEYELDIIRADPRSLELSSPVRNGVSVNLTGASMRFVVKWRPDDADASAVMVKATGGSGIATTASTATVTFAPGDFTSLPYKKVTLWYEWTWNNGTYNEVWLRGRMNVHPNINRT